MIRYKHVQAKRKRWQETISIRFRQRHNYVLLEGNLEAAGHGQAGGINDRETISENTYQRRDGITYYI